MAHLRKTIVALSVAAITSAPALSATSSPEGMYRTFETNYKDMTLATCIDTAYANNADVSKDAGSSVTAMREWTYYDLERSPALITTLVAKYLARDYTHPLVESEIKGVKFDFLKCLDLYHSQELDALTKKLVDHPTRTYMKNVKPH